MPHQFCIFFVLWTKVRLLDYESSLGVCLSLWLFVSVRPSVRRPFVCLSVCPSVSVCLIVCLSVCPSVRVFICLSVYLSISLSARPPVCLFVCQSVRLSVSLRIRPSVSDFPSLFPSVRLSSPLILSSVHQFIHSSISMHCHCLCVCLFFLLSILLSVSLPIRPSVCLSV